MALSLNDIQHKRAKTRSNRKSVQRQGPQQRPWAEDIPLASPETLEDSTISNLHSLTSDTERADDLVHSLQKEFYSLTLIGQAVKWFKSIQISPQVSIPVPSIFHQRTK